MHVILFDDFKSDTATVYCQTLEFLAIDPDFKADFPVVNARKQVRSRTLQRIMLSTGINVPRMKRTIVAHRLSRFLPKSIQGFLLNSLRTLYMSEQTAPPLDADLRCQLQAEFLSEIAALGTLLGRDLTHWCRDQESGSMQQNRN